MKDILQCRQCGWFATMAFRDYMANLGPVYCCPQCGNERLEYSMEDLEDGYNPDDQEDDGDEGDR